MGKNFRLVFMVIILTAVLVSIGCTTPEDFSLSSHDPPKIQNQLTRLPPPLSFEVNAGQTDESVKFLTRGNGYSLFLTPGEVVMVLRKKDRGIASGHNNLTKTTEVLRMQFAGDNPEPQIVGVEELTGKVNYIVGNDPTAWKTHLPTYSKVRYKNVYPGIDLVFYGNQGELEFDFIVSPGADPHTISLHFQGAKAVDINANGDLVLYMDEGEIRQLKPVLYQEVSGNRQEISGRYVLKDQNHIGFRVASYDSRKPLVIDPVMIFSTYLGGTSGDVINDIVVDSERNIYLIGTSASTNFPVANSFQPSNAGGANDAVVTKLSPDGSTLIYSTYLGGGTGANANEQGRGIAVDHLGYVFVTGFTDSTDFPTLNALQPSLAGAMDAYVAKLTPDGSALVFSTYLGGMQNDVGNDITIGPKGNAYLIGWTNSPDFPTMNPMQAIKGGGRDAYVAKLTPDGSALVYSTYLGGSGLELGAGIAVDGDGHACVTGETMSANFPVKNAIQGTLVGNKDAYVAKLTSDGSALVFSTYLGGNEETVQEIGLDVAVDPAGFVYVTGRTASSDFPILNPFQGAKAGEWDAFVTKLTSQGTLVYSTYLGGGGRQQGGGLTVDSLGVVSLTGSTDSLNFPTKDPLQGTRAGDSDAFLTQLTQNGADLLFSTYLGGDAFDRGNGITVDSAGSLYIVGSTSSSNFPTFNPRQGSNAGEADGFVAKIILPKANLVPLFDSLLRANSKNTNEGNNHVLAVQKSGRTRAVMTFALPDTPLVLENAKLLLTLERPTRRWGRTGRMIDVHRLLESFTEGNGFVYGQPKVLQDRGSGSGVTWNCATDTDIANRKRDCDIKWGGGLDAAETVTDSVLVTNGQTGEVSWDVTIDVQAALTNQDTEIQWLLKKAMEQRRGKAVFYSKEGAADVGDVTKAPRLELEF